MEAFVLLGIEIVRALSVKDVFVALPIGSHRGRKHKTKFTIETLIIVTQKASY